MSSEAPERDQRDSASGQADVSDAGPLGWLPRLSGRRARIEGQIARLASDPGCRQALRRLDEALGTSLETGRPDLLWRASGLLRPGLFAQFSRRAFRARLALGIETPLAHAIVDRLLGFDRIDAEGRRQLTPVEWGVLTFVVARSLDELIRGQCPTVPDDLVLDRVGPEPFDPGNLGPIVTLRWVARIGSVVGSIRLWIPESQILNVQAEWPLPPGLDRALVASPRFRELDSDWHAVAGSIAMPRGLASLRAGGVLPIDRAHLGGTPQSPTGAVALELVLAGRGGRCRFEGEVAPRSGGGRLILNSTLRRDPIPREAHPVSSSPAPEPAPAPGQAGPSPADIPVTLTVELGRINLTLTRLADLRPGDVVELARHSREPVELTSGGRLVARGELVQIDTELGVRVTQVFL